MLRRWWVTLRQLLASGTQLTRGWILGQIQTKVFRVFLLAIHSHLYSFALRFLVHTQANSYYFYRKVTVLYTVKEREGKPDRKPYTYPYVLRNPYRTSSLINLKIIAQKPQRNWTFMNLAAGFTLHINPFFVWKVRCFWIMKKQFEYQERTQTYLANMFKKIG